MSSNQWIEAGVMLRGSLRQELVRANIEFTEAKSMLSSVFYIPNTDDYRRVVRTLKESGYA